jgi:hypothetical protein
MGQVVVVGLDIAKSVLGVLRALRRSRTQTAPGALLPLGEQLAYIVGRVLIEQTAHQNRKGLSRFQPNPLSC